MIITLYYTKDKNGDMYLSEPRSPGAKPNKNENRGEWVSNSEIGNLHWYKINEDGSTRDCDSEIFKFITNVKDLPEPSWEDEVPMEVHFNISVRVSYVYEY